MTENSYSSVMVERCVSVANVATLSELMTQSMQALKYRKELLSLFKLLHAKTFSKRGFSSSGKLISSTLLTLSHTYPLENKFVNPDEWESERTHLS